MSEYRVTVLSTVFHFAISIPFRNFKGLKFGDLEVEWLWLKYPEIRMFQSWNSVNQKCSGIPIPTRRFHNSPFQRGGSPIYHSGCTYSKRVAKALVAIDIAFPILLLNSKMRDEVAGKDPLSTTSTAFRFWHWGLGVNVVWTSVKKTNCCERHYYIAWPWRLVVLM